MRTRTTVDGGGAALCSVCQGRLDYSWRVSFDNGGSENRCSTHLSEEFDNPVRGV